MAVKFNILNTMDPEYNKLFKQSDYPTRLWNDHCQGQWYVIWLVFIALWWCCTYHMLHTIYWVRYRKKRKLSAFWQWGDMWGKLNGDFIPFSQWLKGLILKTSC